MLFYVWRHTGADGSFEWYVLNGHTRRRASKSFPTRAAAAAEREKLQARLDLAKAKVLRGAHKNNAPAAGAESCGASYGEGRLAGQEPPETWVPTNHLREGPTSPLHLCTARPQKKPRGGRG
jgi:hypothetical protein